MASDLTPEGKAAVIKGVIAEGVLLVVGIVLWLATSEPLWLIGAIATGSAVMVLLLAQSGALSRRE